MLPSNYINRDKMILGVVIMSLFNIPDGVDVIEVRKKVNKMLSEARKKAKSKKCILCG